MQTICARLASASQVQNERATPIVPRKSLVDELQSNVRNVLVTDDNIYSTRRNSGGAASPAGPQDNRLIGSGGDVSDFEGAVGSNVGAQDQSIGTKVLDQR